MRLTDLDPQFIRVNFDNPDFVAGRKSFSYVDCVDDAQGIMFLCPKCYAGNGGPKGTHSVICWSRSRGTPEDMPPLPGRWTLEGTGFHDLTLNGDSSAGPGTGARSVLLVGGCEWHGFVTNGEAA